MKALLKQIITDFHAEAIPAVVPRAINIPQFPAPLRKANVFIGMRRSGKTYFMYQHMHNLLNSGIEQKKFFNINFEDDRLLDFKVGDFQAILDAYFELYPAYAYDKNLHFFFDEIQNIEGWEKFIRRLLDKEQMQIYITGASAKALSKEIATSLRGRCCTTEVFPMSFSEFLAYQQFLAQANLSSKQLALLRNLSTEYLQYGGFPEALFINREQHRLLMQEYVNTVVYRDVIERHAISNTHVVRLFLKHCLQNIASSLSITKTYQSFKSMGKSVGKNSLYEYLDYFEDAYLLFPISIYDLSLRKRQANPKKIYCADPGLINAYAIKPEIAQDIVLENAVFNHLRRATNEIFYYRTETGKEVDFFVKHFDGRRELFQVCLEMSSESTRAREINALLEAIRELNLRAGWIITLDQEEQIKVGNLTVTLLPFWKFSRYNLSDKYTE